MEFKLPKMGFKTIFTLEKFNSEGIVEEYPSFENEVLDCGFLASFTTTFWTSDSVPKLMEYVNIGSSGVAVDPVNQTGLQARLYSTSTLFNSQSGWTSSEKPYPLYWGHYRIFQWSIGSCTGTFREIGMSINNNSGYFNRALIRDTGGNPIEITVAADEGLRVRVECRLYIDPALKLYSQIFKLRTYGANAGTITLSKGSGTRTIDASLFTNQDSMKLELDTLFGAGYVCHCYGNSANGFDIYFHCNTPAASTLTIQSHTLTGGSQAPSIEETQTYVAAPRGQVTLTNETTSEVTTHDFTFLTEAGQDKGYMNIFTGRSTRVSNSQCSWLGWTQNMGGPLLVYPPSRYQPKNFSSTGEKFYVSSITLDHAATLAEPWYTIKFGYTPGYLGTGDKNLQVFSFCSHFYWDTTAAFLAWAFVFDAPFVIKDTEEFSYKVTIPMAKYV